ncbi:hypothetical protein FJZ19_01425 [Candidatus Pacearchaeota archaeon]|nr:hypothetical protein [Candidatus Pacearchaeota archaeon]
MDNTIQPELSRFAKFVVGAVGSAVVALCTYLPIMSFTEKYNSSYPEIQSKLNSWVQSSPRNEVQERKDRLRQLERQVLEKAQMFDGKLGLSFEDQANLARELGYKGTLSQGRRFYFGQDIRGFPESQLIIGNESLEVSEETAQNYLKK